MPRLLIAVLVSSLLIACSSNPAQPDTGNDIVQDVGSSDVGGPDVGRGSLICDYSYPYLLDFNFTTAGAIDGDGKHISMHATHALWKKWSVEAIAGVTISVELHEGRGIFAESIHSGTFALEGAELDPGTCGFCLKVNGGRPLGGTAEVDLSRGRLWVQLTHVVIEDAYDPATDSRCTSLLPTTTVDGFLRKTCDLEASAASQCDTGTTCTRVYNALEVCLPSCNPLAPSACVPGEGCYSHPSAQAFTCLPAGQTPYEFDVKCNRSAMGTCVPGSECLADDRCHKYCDTSAEDTGCLQDLPCVDLGIGSNIGACGM